ncbi:KTSC domain-containing protein [Pseudonocardia lacus]|uniref:KTSC domain-containing protein n=1 Tax=Pseudonocardia lacus TaxID=2835865 RepID=UPI001BDD0B71|nr:KTSC domain-containing protein [Pseudonocardia lacus]
MIRQQVESSGVRSLGYDPANRALEVEFAGGGVYRYLDVPIGVVERLAVAPSIGSYVARKIRNVYRYRRVG